MNTEHYTQDGRALSSLSVEELEVCVRKHLNTDPALAKAAKNELNRRNGNIPESASTPPSGTLKHKKAGTTASYTAQDLQAVKLVDVDVPFSSIFKICLKVFFAMTLIGVCFSILYFIVIVVIFGGLFGALSMGFN